MSGKSKLIAVAFFNFFAVMLGYEGIAKLHRTHFPPFNGEHGFFNVLVPFPPPPNWLVLFWDASWGKAIFWGGCLLIPFAATYLSHRRMRYVAAPVVLAWTLAAWTGFWICFHALFNALGNGGF